MRKRIEEIEQDADLATVYLSSCVTTNKLQEGRQLDFPGKVYTEGGSIPAIILTDTGASANGFVDSKFAKAHKLHLVPLLKPRYLRIADRKLSQRLENIAQVKFAIRDHLEEI